GLKIPPSLRNLYKELASDLGIAPPSHGFLEHWAKQGVLMFNSVMTVRESEANSHKGQGWENFSDSVIRALNERSRQVVFVLWGGYAKKKAKLVDSSRHKIISSGHPSPLSIKHFAGSQPFSKINSALAEAGETPIDWQLPEL
ncbi:MAG: uracil-DNA glycosylase, partial [Kofleriaceae bacterium]|nr:uracil-DNA glycosylase [Kofleriaceae bacterium]